MNALLRWLLPAVVCIVLALPAWAQSTTATVFGAVIDAQRAAIAGVVVVLKNLDTGQAREGVSDSSGSFRIVGVTPGRYELRARKAGFAEHVVPSLALAIAAEVEISFTMQIASLVTEVTVLADDAAIGSRTGPGRTFTSREIDDLPVTARDFVNLALLTPGILVDRGTGRNPNPAISSSGQTGRNNTFLVDGLSIDDHFSGAPRGSLSLDAVKEFIVRPTSFSAEYGQASGAVVSVRTRSGTNVTMGRVFYFRRGDRWNATNAAARLVDPPEDKSRVEGHTAGGFLGGALVHDRAFYLVSMEYSARNSESIVTSSVLQAFRPGAPTRLPVRLRDPQVLGRVDLNLSNRTSVTVRYRSDRLSETNQTADPGPEGLVAPERRHDATRRDRDLAVLANRALGSTAFNEVRLQYSHRLADQDVSRYCSGCAAYNYSGLLLGQAPVVPANRTEQRWQLANTLTWLAPDVLGEHTVKIGGDASVIDIDAYGPGGFNGIWRFGDLPFETGNPSTFPRMYTVFSGDPNSRDRYRLYALFVEDTWRPRSSLTLTVGARWDYEQSTGISTDRDNLAPRIGVAFDPWAQGRTVFRGGFGIYYDAVLARALNNSQSGTRITSTIVNNPNFPDPFSEPRRTGFRIVPPGVNRLAANLRTPYTEQASAGVRHVIGPFAVSADGVWAQGDHLLRTRDLNYPNLDDPFRARPDPTLGRVRVRETEGHSWYRALIVGLQKVHERKHSFGVAYTLSRSERDTEDWEFLPNDQRDYDAERGPANSDVRHRLVANVNVDLPIGARFGAILTAQSAFPYNITVGSDENRDGEPGPDRPAGVGRNSARGDDFWQLDVRVSKEFRLNGRPIELLLEAFNVTNHTNWIEFDGNRENLATTFGKPTGAAIAREVQLGFRIGF